VLLTIALAHSGAQLTANAHGSVTMTLGGYAIALIVSGLALHVSGHARRTQGMHGGAAPRLPLELAELFWMFVVLAGLLVCAILGVSPHLP
jgi:hypothetical protein